MICAGKGANAAAAAGQTFSCEFIGNLGDASVRQISRENARAREREHASERERERK